MFEVAVIGAGNMGESMIRGWLEAGALGHGDVVVSDREISRKRSLSQKYNVKKAGSNTEAAGEAKVVMLAVKPEDSPGVLEELGGVVGKGHTLISIVAGLKIGSIREKLGDGPTLVRVMPNMAAQVRASVSAYAIDPGSGEFDRNEVESLLEAVGEAVEVGEEWMDLVTALSGSGPAYFFLMVESLEQAGVEEGLPRETARQLATATLWGSAKVLKETGRDAGELRKAVSSPGGTTLAALDVLEKQGFNEAITGAVKAARRRAGELSR